MLKRAITHIIILGLILVVTGSITAGPPVNLWQQGDLWLAAELGTVNRMLPDENRAGVEGDPLPSRSKRGFLTVGYGVYPHLDLFAMLGAADLSINSSDPTFNNYAADMTIAWGGGAKAGYHYADWNLGATYTGTLIGFTSKGEVANNFRRVVNTYQWWEIQNELTFSYPLTTLIPFLGVEKTILMGTHEVEDYFQGRLQPDPDDTNNYSDMAQQFRPLAGVVMLLPNAYSLYLKFGGIDADEFFLSVGLCQSSR
jgi:hypothetical protein